jgi:predicted dehydrogenase
VRALDAAREQHMARRLAEACRGRARVLAVLPSTRLHGVVAQLKRQVL